MSRAAPEPKANMGKPEPRVDGRLKVTGEACYGSDFPVSNPAFAYLVTSSIAKGGITSMDLRDAKAVPGVLDIFTHENTGELINLKFGAGGGGPTTSIQDFGPKIQHDGPQRSPKRVLDTHPPDQRTQVRINLRPPSP